MIKHKKGFTIIEVVLVLAIAGLIFLMVFVALPTLQRSQRDTQRRQDAARVVTAVTEWFANGNPATGSYLNQQSTPRGWGTWGSGTQYSQNNTSGEYKGSGCDTASYAAS